ncbi:hypothetical protein B0O99DRAFT_62033 [Bisporella sp. PMI_857]|nr:hypothetical protein B0O99DRAFT_62033 [Bisporella sp. PMI_857]
MSKFKLAIATGPTRFILISLLKHICYCLPIYSSIKANTRKSDSQIKPKTRRDRKVIRVANHRRMERDMFETNT